MQGGNSYRSYEKNREKWGSWPKVTFGEHDQRRTHKIDIANELGREC